MSIFRHQNERENHDVRITNKDLKNVENFKYLRMKVIHHQKMLMIK
jgi:hypothetical protein